MMLFHIHYCLFLYIIVMSQLFPTIKSKKVVTEEDERMRSSHVRRKSQSSFMHAEIIDQLKSKVVEQKKQIEHRNQTIIGLQRNFDSLSTIILQEKEQSAQLREQIQQIRDEAALHDRENEQLRSKCIRLQTEVDAARGELRKFSKNHTECERIFAERNSLMSELKSLEHGNRDTFDRLEALRQKNKQLQKQVAWLKKEGMLRKQMQERLIQMEDELKKVTGENKLLQDRQKLLQKNKVNKAQNDELLKDLRQKLQEHEKKSAILEKDKNDAVRNQKNLKAKLEQMKKQIQSRESFSKMKQEQDQKLKEEVKNAKIKNQQLRQYNLAVEMEIQKIQNKMRDQTAELEKKIAEYQKRQTENVQALEQHKNEIKKLKEEIANKNGEFDQSLSGLEDKISEINRAQIFYRLKTAQKGLSRKKKAMDRILQNCSQVERKLKEIEQKYGNYLPEIDYNLPKGVVISNQAQKKLVQAKIEEINNKNEAAAAQKDIKINQLKSEIQGLKQSISKLEESQKISKKEQEKNLSDIAKAEQTIKAKQLKEKQLVEKIQHQKQQYQALEENLQKVKNDLEAMLKQEKKRNKEAMNSIQQQLLGYKNELQKTTRQLKLERQDHQNKQKDYQARKQRQMKVFQEQNQRTLAAKQQQLQIMQKKNKMLWQDNRKLKQQVDLLCKQLDKITETSNQKKNMQIQRYKRQMNERMALEERSKRDELSNVYQIKKLLVEKSKQMKQLLANQQSLKQELEFYKNRNKELEGLTSRLKQSHAEEVNQLNQHIEESRKAINGLGQKNKKITSAIVEKDRSLGNAELSKKFEEINKKYNNQLVKNQQAKQMIGLIRESIVATDNIFLCNYCVQVVKNCVRLKQCGHIFCQTCKEGYEALCSQCHTVSKATNDSAIDEAVLQGTRIKDLLQKMQPKLG